MHKKHMGHVLGAKSGLGLAESGPIYASSGLNPSFFGLNFWVIWPPISRWQLFWVILAKFSLSLSQRMDVCDTT